MVTELKKVIQKAEQLNSEEQKSIAKMIDDELQWENTLNDTQDKLASLAEEAIKEYQAGKTKKEDW